MKAHFLLILIVIQFSNEVYCCSEDINVALDNAFVSCSNNITCNSYCYRGYIFPNGNIKERYCCQSGEWIPMLATCKRIPLVSVTYSVIWSFSDVPLLNCMNISSRLDSLEEILEKTLAENCHQLEVNAKVEFSYLFLAFQVKANFTAIYHNFTTLNTLGLCINYTILSFSNIEVIKSMFENVTCGNFNTSNIISENLHVHEKQYTCPNDMELHEVTSPVGIMDSQYCDKVTTVTEMLTKTTQIGTPESPTLINEVSFTSIDFNSSQRTTLETLLSTDENSTISQSTTLKIEGSSNDGNILSPSTTLTTEDSSTDQDSNTNQFTTITEFSIEKDLSITPIIYIAAPVGGVFLIILFIISIVCFRKRVKDPENLSDDIKMTHETNDRINETSFKGELIENEQYKSADDVMDGERRKDFTKTLSCDFSAVPYVKEKTDTTLRQDHGEYSYPSKMAVDNNSRLNIAFDDGDLDVETTDTFRTPNPCQYAVVNKSRKM